MHIIHLQKALLLAQQRRGFCAPNPAVGAVIVKDGHVLAEGIHQAAGKPHAEIDALSKLSEEQARDATIYITLEPCAHYGKTPPCVDMLIARGIRAVYYGCKDPNPLVSGKGEEKLQMAGVKCSHVPVPEIELFYRSYYYWLEHKRPWVTAKLACSLDGKIAGKNGQALQITGEAAAVFTHKHRKETDAILTTAATLLQDDPQLNARLQQETYKKPIYVLDRQLRLLPALQIFNTSASLTVFHALGLAPPLTSNVQYVAVTEQYGKLSLPEVLAHIGQDGMHDLWVEAGGRCFSGFITQKLAQRAYIYLAPKCLGREAYSAFSNEMVGILEEAKHVFWHPLGRDTACELSFFD